MNAIWRMLARLRGLARRGFPDEDLAREMAVHLESGG
jgi:hypothetical protein